MDKQASKGLTQAPLFSVLTPVYKTPPSYLSACIRSVTAQTFNDWELLLVDDGNDDRGLLETLEKFAAGDQRITVIRCAENSGIARASQAGTLHAKGKYLALLDHDDLLSPQALERVAGVITTQRNIDYVYTDEDKVDSAGFFVQPFFKPDWSPERFLRQMYTCHLSVIRTRLVREVGGFRSGFDGSQDHDLILRVVERTRRIHHIREILYHWRIHEASTANVIDRKEHAGRAREEAVRQHLQRSGVRATVSSGKRPGTIDVRRLVIDEPLVSLVVPTAATRRPVRGSAVVLLQNLIESVESKTTYTKFEWVIVHDTRIQREQLSNFTQAARRDIRLVPYAYQPGAFNFSEAVNLGALHARGRFLLLLNDDTELITPDWLEHLLGLGQVNDVGAVGGLLYFADDTIQHAGLTCAAGPYHMFYRAARGLKVLGDHLSVVRETTALTGACLFVMRDKYLQVGGFTHELPNNFNDVDFCLKLREAGWRNLWTPDVEMYHFESQSRTPKVASREIELLNQRWPSKLRVDPYYNPNLIGTWPQWEPWPDWDRYTYRWPAVVNSSAEIDAAGYLLMNPDLMARVAADPDWDLAQHFSRSGRFENRLQLVRSKRCPSDMNAVRVVPASLDNYTRLGYLLMNPDLLVEVLRDPTFDVLEHFLRLGLKEGRKIAVSREFGRQM